MAYRVDLVIDQGSDYTNNVEITDDQGDPIDLTGYTGRGQIRRHYTSLTSVPFVIDLESDQFSSKVHFSLAANTSSAMAAGRYVYDIEIVSGANTVSRIIEGVVTLTPEVTR